VAFEHWTTYKMDAPELDLVFPAFWPGSGLALAWCWPGVGLCWPCVGLVLA
jgi:hypothetical protein